MKLIQNERGGLVVTMSNDMIVDEDKDGIKPSTVSTSRDQRSRSDSICSITSISPLKESSAIRDNDVLQSASVSFESPTNNSKGIGHYKRVFPRIGSQYQTRIIKVHNVEPVICPATARPKPEIFSAEHPYVIEKEIFKNMAIASSILQRDSDSKANEEEPLLQLKNSDNDNSIFKINISRHQETGPSAIPWWLHDQPNTQRMAQRGGLCIHRAHPSSSKEAAIVLLTQQEQEYQSADYLSFCQNLMIPHPCPPLPSSSTNQSSNNNILFENDNIEAFKQEMIEQYGTLTSYSPAKDKARNAKRRCGAETIEETIPPPLAKRAHGRRGRKRKNQQQPQPRNQSSNNNKGQHHQNPYKRTYIKRRQSSAISDASAISAASTAATAVEEGGASTSTIVTSTPAKHYLAEEDNEHMLQYLCLKHNSNVASARLSIIVNIQSGRAVKSRKILHKQQHTDRFKRPPIDSSLSWRKRYEELAIDLKPMVGDFSSCGAASAAACSGYKVDKYTATAISSDNVTGASTTASSSSSSSTISTAVTTKYPYHTLSSLLTFSSSEAAPTGNSSGGTQQQQPYAEEALSSISSACDRDDMKGVWRSVLSCGHQMVQSLTDYCNAKTCTPYYYMTALQKSQLKERQGQRQKFLDVISFVRNAYALPTPEESFGSRHIVVEQISICFNQILDYISRGRNEQARLYDKLYVKNQQQMYEEGVDVNQLKKFTDDIDRKLPFILDEELHIVRAYIDKTEEFQKRLDDIVDEKYQILSTVNDGSTGVNTSSTSRETSCNRSRNSSVDDITAESTIGDNRGDANDTIIVATDTLSIAEYLAHEGRTSGLRSQNLVLLEKMIQKTYNLRDRIRKWMKEHTQGEKGSVKYVESMVKEAGRLDLSFPELQKLLEFHLSMNTWVDRANVAIRSRISLSEIEALIVKGEDMHLDLTDYIDKLHTRAKVANEWIERLKEKVQCPILLNNDSSSKVNNVKWMSLMRKALWSGQYNLLHEMASEGSRIPVEIDCVKMLQLEIDAKNWSMKAKKWIPLRQSQSDTSSAAVAVASAESPPAPSTVRKGKLEDLRDHIAKAETLREKLCLSDEEKEAWVLDGEVELNHILKAADNWFDKYQPFLEFDNRRNEKRNCISMSKLREIAEEASLIHANLGNSSTKISRILVQAETWHEKHKDLLRLCGLMDISSSLSTLDLSLKRPLSMTEMNAAIEDANTSIPLDIDEAVRIKELCDKIHNWFDRASLAAPKRSKRSVRGKSSSEDRHSLEDLVALIEEAPSLPIDTGADVQRLKMQLSVVQSFRLKAQSELGEIAKAFNSLRTSVNVAYDIPEEFLRDEMSTVNPVPVVTSSEEVAKKSTSELDDAVAGSTERSQSPEGEQNPMSGDVYGLELGLNSDSAEDVGVKARLGGGGGIYRLVTSLLKDARATGICTAEEKAAELLEKVAKWVVQSLKYVNSPKDIFERKEYITFKKFIESGRNLVSLSKTIENETDDMIENVGLIENLNSSWRGVLSDQLVRLRTLNIFYDQFASWSGSAEELLKSSENKIPKDSLLKLVEESSYYPAALDIVQKIRNRAKSASLWAKKTKGLLHSNEKMSLQEAKDLFEEGEKLNVACSELKMLRNAIREARSWATSVKKIKLESGRTNVSVIQDLVAQHDSLLLEMPDAANKLVQAMKGYCICRQPYSGFMVACDECDEWYHGSCIGVSETQAGKVEKYICVRCGVVRVFKASSATVVSVVRKWISSKYLKKARQVDGQKHQRKVRKEKRDIERLEPDIEALLRGLEQLNGNSVAVDHQVPSNNDNIPVYNNATDCIHMVHPSCDVADNEATTANKICGTAKSSEATPNTTSESLPSKTDVNCNGEVNKEGGGRKGATSKISAKEIEAKLKKAFAALQHCHNRLDILAKQAAARKAIEDKEDSMSDVLKVWCVKVCLYVLIPLTSELAEKSRPHRNGNQSSPMVQIAKEADSLGISQLADVRMVKNAFGCITWSYSAMSVVNKKPKITKIKILIDQLSSLKLPEEKAAKILKSMFQRVTAWQVRVFKVLTPRPGETAPLCLATLKELLSSGKDMPVRLTEESRLRNAIDDNGARHCLCGGPSDGSFMVGCDKCDRWFHGHCVNIDEEAGDALNVWVCPPCSGITTTVVQPRVFRYTQESEESDNEEDAAPNAPNPMKLWPPCGLLTSPKAYESLGGECTSILLRYPVLVNAADEKNPVGLTVIPSNAEQTKGLTPLRTVVPCTQSLQLVQGNAPTLISRQLRVNMSTQATDPCIKASNDFAAVASRQVQTSIQSIALGINIQPQVEGSNKNTLPQKSKEMLRPHVEVSGSKAFSRGPKNSAAAPHRANASISSLAKVLSATQSSKLIKNGIKKVTSQQKRDILPSGVPSTALSSPGIKDSLQVAVTHPPNIKPPLRFFTDNTVVDISQQVKESMALQTDDSNGSPFTVSVSTNGDKLRTVAQKSSDRLMEQKEQVVQSSVAVDLTEKKESSRSEVADSCKTQVPPGIDDTVPPAVPQKDKGKILVLPDYPSSKGDIIKRQETGKSKLSSISFTSSGPGTFTSEDNDVKMVIDSADVNTVLDTDKQHVVSTAPPFASSAQIEIFDNDNKKQKIIKAGNGTDTMRIKTAISRNESDRSNACTTADDMKEKHSSTIVFLSESLQLQTIHLEVNNDNAVAVKVSNDSTSIHGSVKEKIMLDATDNSANLNATSSSVTEKNQGAGEDVQENNINVSTTRSPENVDPSVSVQPGRQVGEPLVSMEIEPRAPSVVRKNGTTDT